MKLEEVQQTLQRLIERAQAEEKSLDHVLLYGSQPLTRQIYSYLSKDMKLPIRIVAGSTITRPGDLAAILTHLKRDHLLYVEELTNLEKSVAKVLYPAMVDYVLDLVIGGDAAAKNVRLNLPRFTVIASTARPELLPRNLPALFSVQFRVDDD